MQQQLEMKIVYNFFKFNKCMLNCEYHVANHVFISSRNINQNSDVSRFIKLLFWLFIGKAGLNRGE